MIVFNLFMHEAFTSSDGLRFSSKRDELILLLLLVVISPNSNELSKLFLNLFVIASRSTFLVKVF